ncbi:hypothetical protein [Amycolatopsis sp. Hca4]|uniref:hypothetical protein n=1 Tax=Amycolatopsis sp. Hca4 TaxID=2742131 RepID=UPI0020CAF36A|nr:hypothetical protein [Amycolatopsis sp. Hca4]
MKKLLVLAVLLLVSGCGVKPTPVVAAGPAPTLRNPADDGSGTDVVLYYVLNGRLTPVTRPRSLPASVESTLAMLMDGPSADERASGYTTELPRRTGAITLTHGAPPTITVPFPVQPLSGTGINQLVCTAFAALVATGGYTTDGTLAVVAPDVRLPYQTCQA